MLLPHSVPEAQTFHHDCRNSSHLLISAISLFRPLEEAKPGMTTVAVQGGLYIYNHIYIYIYIHIYTHTHTCVLELAACE